MRLRSISAMHRQRRKETNSAGRGRFNFVPVELLVIPFAFLCTRELTSKKPDKKFLGNFAVGSSSALKYFMICVNCFQ